MITVWITCYTVWKFIYSNYALVAGGGEDETQTPFSLSTVEHDVHRSVSYACARGPHGQMVNLQWLADPCHCAVHRHHAEPHQLCSCACTDSALAPGHSLLNVFTLTTYNWPSFGLLQHKMHACKPQEFECALHNIT